MRRPPRCRVNNPPKSKGSWSSIMPSREGEGEGNGQWGRVKCQGLEGEKPDRERAGGGTALDFGDLVLWTAWCFMDCAELSCRIQYLEWVTFIYPGSPFQPGTSNLMDNQYEIIRHRIQFTHYSVPWWLIYVPEAGRSFFYCSLYILASKCLQHDIFNYCINTNKSFQIDN